MPTLSTPIVRALDVLEERAASLIKGREGLLLQGHNQALAYEVCKQGLSMHRERIPHSIDRAESGAVQGEQLGMIGEPLDHGSKTLLDSVERPPTKGAL